MRLPRRVPWASIAELDELCAWIYTDEADINAKTKAINRLSAWRSITALPHALDATLALLSVLVQDSQPATSYLSLRHSYAAAIIRLVNGLVDPLQRGLYARSIASIANQLGLPPWLVELRHAATHEDLPSLELLRQAARESMAWLLHNYFLPTINPSTALVSQVPSLRALAPILKEYKSLSKLVARDASLKAQQQQIKTILRDVERWIAEAAVATNVAGGDLGWSNENAKERWALDRLCDALLEKSALVPLSKKKRVFPEDAFYPPAAAVAVWTPLLYELTSTHPELRSILVNRIIARLTADIPQEEIVSISVDTTHDVCLARWAFWIIENLSPNLADTDSRKEALATLIIGLGPPMGSSRDIAAAKSLMQALCTGNTELEGMLSLLVRPQQVGISDWTMSDISVMQERLEALLALPEPQPDLVAGETSAENDAPRTTLEIAPGWRLLGTDSSWKPSPIGAYVAG
ncbi:Las1-like-domain-containing protein [Mycena amicta]|nr:Las1-like-domain-containing protein [Mycena amicta]